VDTEFTVDWLAYTAICNEGKPASQYSIQQQGWRESAALHGYTRAVTSPMGANVAWNPSVPAMGVHCTYSGSALRSLGKGGLMFTDVMQFHYDNNDGCSRIDLALDVRDSGLSIPALFREINRLKSNEPTLCNKCSAQSYSLIESENGGATLYVGSRTSMQMLRIYNKAAEQGLTGDWLRFEVEVKGSKALALHKQLCEGYHFQMYQRCQQLIVSMVDFNFPAWREIFTQKGVKIGVPKITDRQTRVWLMSQVAPAVAKYIQTKGEEDFLVDFNREVNILLGRLDR